jgi:hypothetical protein
MGERGGGATSFTYFNPKTNQFSLSAGQARHVLGQWILFWAVKYKNKKRSLQWFCCRFLFGSSHHPLLAHVDLLHRAKKTLKRI